MIPRTIHYCWFGGRPLPDKFRPYLDSWRQHMPDFEVREWNEENLPVVSEYVRQNLKEESWAFVSDYARFQVLFNEGGIYLDTDVELLRPLPELETQAFLGFENVLDRVSKNPLGTAILGFPAGHSLCSDMMKAYDRSPNSRPLGTDILTRMIRKMGLSEYRHHPIQFEFVQIAGLRVYHSDILYPDMRNRFPSRDCLPENTKAIHHVAGSWTASKLDHLPWWRRFYDYRLDRKILRPVEKVIKGCLGKS